MIASNIKNLEYRIGEELNGKQTYRVDVFNTTHFPFLWESRSMFAPSSSASSSGFISKIYKKTSIRNVNSLQITNTKKTANDQATIMNTPFIPHSETRFLIQYYQTSPNNDSDCKAIILGCACLMRMLHI